jgi:zinc protease
MKLETFFKKLPALMLMSVVAYSSAIAQRPGSPEPRQERLLNGLRVLIWNDPGSGRIDVKLRIHSGSSFDPQEREGLMRMLADAIFPSEASRDFFREDLGGELKITVNYDYIQFDASSTREDFVRLIETFASALISPTIDNEVADMARARVLRELETELDDPSAVADLAVQARLFGTFPYGRPILGTKESLDSIDFADLKFAYGRFFGADNATMTISGDVDGNAVNRVVRRLFGAWLKGSGRTPSTFRQPDPPDSSVQIVNYYEGGIPGSRVAVRGVARRDKEYAASLILERILDTRVKSEVPASKRDAAFVRSHAHILPGWVVFGVEQERIRQAGESENVATLQPVDVADKVLKAEISEAEFSSARSAVISSRNAMDKTAEWLDADTFRLSSAKAERDEVAKVSLGDVRKLAARLRESTRARVIVFDKEAGGEDQ